MLFCLWTRPRRNNACNHREATASITASRKRSQNKHQTKFTSHMFTHIYFTRLSSYIKIPCHLSFCTILCFVLYWRAGWCYDAVDIRTDEVRPSPRHKTGYRMHEVVSWHDDMSVDMCIEYSNSGWWVGLQETHTVPCTRYNVTLFVSGWIVIDHYVIRSILQRCIFPSITLLPLS